MLTLGTQILSKLIFEQKYVVVVQVLEEESIKLTLIIWLLR